jgi:hypothetical protein
MARDEDLTMNSRDLFGDRYNSGIRQENKKKHMNNFG